MQEFVRVAAVSLDSQAGETARNIEKMAVWCRRGAEEGAGLVLFPELSLTGFLPNHPVGDHAAWLAGALRAAWRMALPLSAPEITQLAAIAGETAVMISAGLLEDAGNVLYNTQVLVGAGGLAGAWRKMHVPMFEMPFYNGGPAPAVAALPFARLGVNICFDALLPESTRLLALQNVEIVLFPFAADPPPVTPQGWADWASPALRSRCRENGVFGVACNYAGRVSCAGVEQWFPGGGMVVGPAGDVLAQSDAPPGQPHMLVTDLRRDDLLAARAAPEYLFRFRRPDLYGPLAG